MRFLKSNASLDIRHRFLSRDLSLIGQKLKVCVPFSAFQPCPKTLCNKETYMDTHLSVYGNVTMYYLNCKRNVKCQLKVASGHYQKTHKCRVSPVLPSARPRALGKNSLCRVSDVAHGIPKRYRVPAVGKESHSARLCRVPAGEHSAKTAHVPSTRARRATAVKVADDC